MTDELFNNLVINPSVDSIQEFKIQKSQYPAEFGGKASALINVATRAGTNAFRGSLFEFLRHDVFDAHNYFVRATGRCRRCGRTNLAVRSVARWCATGASFSSAMKDSAYSGLSRAHSRCRPAVGRQFLRVRADLRSADDRARHRRVHAVYRQPDPRRPYRSARDGIPGARADARRPTRRSRISPRSGIKPRTSLSSAFASTIGSRRRPILRSLQHFDADEVSRSERARCRKRSCPASAATLERGEESRASATHTCSGARWSTNSGSDGWTSVAVR